jgi:hypothetical protein
VPGRCGSRALVIAIVRHIARTGIIIVTIIIVAFACPVRAGIVVAVLPSGAGVVVVAVFACRVRITVVVMLPARVRIGMRT